MTIVSEKISELAEAYRKLKGRVVYRGDIGKDEYGSAAMCQEMSANPTTVQGLSSCLAYGSIPGHKVTTADAVQAYIQAKLKSQYPTWIKLPPELSPAWWRDHFVRPVVRLIKSLYGHPEAGAHWERHLEEILKGMGAQKCSEFLGNYFFPETRLLLAVYVDDFTLAGPVQGHDKFWHDLAAVVTLIRRPLLVGSLAGSATSGIFRMEPTTTLRCARAPTPWS
jgi:hypothetical protein